MTLRRTLTTLLLGLGLTVGTQTILESNAYAGPFEVLSQSTKGGKRTHKKSKRSKSKSKSSSKKKKKRSKSSRRAVRTRTSRSSRTTVKNRRPRRTTTRRTTTRHRPSSSSSRRTVKNRRPRRTTTRRTTTHRRTSRPTHRRTTHRRTTHRHRRGSTVRKTTYHSHHHRSRPRSRKTTYHTSSTATRHDANADANAVEAYLTGGLGFSGFASNEITDLALPGAGYHLAVGAKGGFIGAELGLNGGGYTFDPAEGSTDLAMVGLSGDIRLQPKIAFFEPFLMAGIGGYALQDAVIDEQATGLGLRLGGGADFRFRDFAFRLHYTHANYGLGDRNGGFDGDLSARTETLGGSLVWYF